MACTCVSFIAGGADGWGPPAGGNRRFGALSFRTDFWRHCGFWRSTRRWLTHTPTSAAPRRIRARDFSGDELERPARVLLAACEGKQRKRCARGGRQRAQPPSRRTRTLPSASCRAFFSLSSARARFPASRRSRSHSPAVAARRSRSEAIFSSAASAFFSADLSFLFSLPLVGVVAFSFPVAMAMGAQGQGVASASGKMAPALPKKTEFCHSQSGQVVLSERPQLNTIRHVVIWLDPWSRERDLLATVVDR